MQEVQWRMDLVVFKQAQQRQKLKSKEGNGCTTKIRKLSKNENCVAAVGAGQEAGKTQKKKEKEKRRPKGQMMNFHN